MLLLVSASPQPTMPSISQAVGNPTRFDDDVDAAVEADLIEISGARVRFTNPLLGAVLYSEALPDERRRAHRILADIASDPEERARHLALAADGPDEDVAQMLEDAAQGARSHGAPDAAAELAELARVLTPQDRVDARVRRTSQAGRYAFESGQIERAEELLREAAAAASTGPMRAEALLYLSRVAYHRRDTTSSSALADEALREAKKTIAPGEYQPRAGDGSRTIRRSQDRNSPRPPCPATGGALGGPDNHGGVARGGRLYEFVSGKGVPRDKLERAMVLQADLPLRPLRSPAFYEACISMWSDDLARRKRGCAIWSNGRETPETRARFPSCCSS